MENNLLMMDYFTEGTLKKYILDPVDDGRAMCFGLGRMNGSNLRALQNGSGETLVILGLAYE
ncbi:MAG: hypothetical protein AB1921_11805 [Thermodesulfobacteriota bacterium]